MLELKETSVICSLACFTEFSTEVQGASMAGRQWKNWCPQSQPRVDSSKLVVDDFNLEVFVILRIMKIIDMLKIRRKQNYEKYIGLPVLDKTE